MCPAAAGACVPGSFQTSACSLTRLRLQVASYTCTLVCLGVETLEQCVLMAEPALHKGTPALMGKVNARGTKHMLLGMLREWLYARAVGQDAPVLASCPALDAEACFDASCPLAARVGLKKVSSLAAKGPVWVRLLWLLLQG